jgi:septal ring factor EnvC (AmiA/AmiB activator)
VHAKYILPFNPVNSKSVKVKESSTGINLKFKTELPFFAIESGTVIHVGELKNFGKVILVDHGDNKRSVYLGDLNINQKKGDIVKIGQNLGFTEIFPNGSKTFFFQIRINNTPVKFEMNGIKD